MRRFVAFPLLLPFVLALMGSVAVGQGAGKSQISYKVLSIKVKGATRLKEDRVIAASGLKIGQFASEGDFKDALQKLGDTGLFTDLTYSYQYSSAGCRVELQVVENDQLVPIVFDNFVWFSDDELLGLLRVRVGLFDRRLPLGGNLSDQVEDALNAILAERKIEGKADYLRSAGLGGPIDSYIYKINLRAILVRNMEFPGAAASELPALQAVAKQLAGQEYLRTKMKAQERLNFLPVFLARGYLKASFSDAQARVGEDGAETLVDVSFPVAPGRQYRLTGMAWEGNRVLADAELQELIHLKNGEPANAVQLGDDMDEVHKLYGTKGYLFAHADPSAEMDDAQSTVHYQISVTEGDLYRMGELQVDGLPPEIAQRVIAQWQLKKGDPYDNGYPMRFLQTALRDMGQRVNYSIVTNQAINQKDKTVAVTLHFVPK